MTILNAEHNPNPIETTGSEERLIGADVCSATIEIGADAPASSAVTPNDRKRHLRRLLGQRDKPRDYAEHPRDSQIHRVVSLRSLGGSGHAPPDTIRL